MLEQFSATLEKIYAAAADPALWEESLRAIENYTGSTGAVLNLVPKTPTALPIALAGSFSRENCAEYALNYMWRCPRIAFAGDHPDVRVHYDRMVLSETEMDRDATYEWYGTHGLRYYVAGWIGESSTHRAYMSLQRSRRQGHVEPEDVERFALLLRHMAIALSLAVKLGTLEQQSGLTMALVDALPHAVFALDADGKIILANARAERLLEAGDGLIVFDRRLQCRVGSQQPRFERLIAAALAPDPAQARGGWLRIHRASGRPSYVALVAQLAPSQEIFGSFHPKALIFVRDPTDVAFAQEQALREIYGLTEAEARLASALSAGHSIESAAALLLIQPATARDHLKSVFRKVGVSRQQDLIRALASLSTIAAPSSGTGNKAVPGSINGDGQR